MQVEWWLWTGAVGGIAALLIFDLVVVGRRVRQPSVREVAGWVVFYCLLAVAFGLLILVLHGGRYAGEFYAGWLTEYSLSVDNLFVFVVIMSHFAVPAAYQQRVLTVGIVLALAMRAVFIAVGAAAISRFSWVFYVFGAFLVYTAWKLARHKDAKDAEVRDTLLVRAVRRVLPTTTMYDGPRLVTRVSGRLLVTPMLVVMIAIGTTDVLFALDSIPAIFGLTTDPYIVFAANAFALMGLRQLYFLVSGLLERLRYLNLGLCVILCFIGLKLLLEALNASGVPVPTVGIAVSLGVIVLTLAGTVLAGWWADRR
jgi:TerC family integral membrane protein